MKKKLRLEDNDFSYGQLDELYQIAYDITENKEIDVYTYLFYNYFEVIKRKDKVKNMFAYFKKALENNYGNCELIIKKSKN